MALSLAPADLALVAGVLFVGGFVVGLTGFGFAIVGTATLATVFGTRSAVVVMLVPVLAANVSLVGELDREGLRRCSRRFASYVGAALVGTLLGMVLLTRIPLPPLTLALGVFTLLYVGVAQDRIALPGEAFVRERCFVGSTRAKIGLGFLSGAIFGASNVGVQVVAYLRSRGLDRSTFVGVMAMVFLGISLVRVGAAAALGLYAGSALLAASLGGVLPGLLGVAAGKRARPALPAGVQRTAVLGLLTVVGLRLAASGVQALLSG